MIRIWRKQGVPLYLLITGLVLGGVMLTTVLQLTNIRRESQIIAQAQATATFDMAFKLVMDDVERAITPILALVTTSSLLDQQNGLTSFAEANRSYMALSVQALASRKNIFAVNYGFADGTFYSVTALRSDIVRTNYNAPANTAYAVWSVAPDATGTKREWWLYLDENLIEIKRSNVAATYDPRTKTWYKEAMKANREVMTDPYVFTTSRQLGMACAKTMKNKVGVFSVNMTLDNFNTMLSGISLSHSGSLFLMDQGVRIVASSVPAVANRITRGELVHLASLNESEGHGVYHYLVAHNFLTIGSRMVALNAEDWFLQFMQVSIGNKPFNLLIMAPSSDYVGIVDTLFLNSALFSIFAMLASTPLAIWLSMRISNSLRTLMRETQRIATSSIARQERVDSPIYEVKSLAKAIYHMEDTIGNRTEALRGMKEQLEVLVTERTRELSVAIVRAEEASQAKSSFLATMSHEIRTPMNAIIGFTHLFETANLDTRQQDYLGKIRISAEALLTIINDVLDFSKIEARKLTLEHIPFRLHSVVDSVQGIMGLAADKKQLQLNVEVDADVPDTYIGDPTRLHQILLNLMSNAVKFTHEGSVSLYVALDPEQPLSLLAETGQRSGLLVRLRIQVRDTGIGIAPANLVKLFEPFTQADQSVTRKFGGTGLGLVICKQLLELMEGDIYAESVEGVGTTFITRLLLEWQDPADAEEEVANLTSASEELSHHAGALILVVEDNLINQEIVIAMLEPSGLKVIVAENGQVCLDIMKNTAVDLILMDMQMPVMDGLKATRRLRERRHPNGTLRFPADKLPIIAMTANAMSDDKVACLAAGMNDYISKPVNPENMYDRMTYWLTKTRKIADDANEPTQSVEKVKKDFIKKD